MSTATTADVTLERRVGDLAWDDLREQLDARGFAVSEPLLSGSECDALGALFDGGRFRSTIDMARYRFGSGQYKYFNHPLPDQVTELREACYPYLAPIANTWYEQLRLPQRFPDHLKEYLTTCHEAGQTKPTPLVLRYGPGDYNCLHQDIYGTHAFPLQLMVMLSQVDKDYTGGEFVLVENLPRAQSRARVTTLQQGQAVIWPTRHRPGQGTRGHYRITVRHGVSPIHTGNRQTLGIIFHDAA